MTILRQIKITETDRALLFKLMDEARQSNARFSKDIEGLRQELNRAQVIDVSAIPSNVITMRSKAELEDLDSGEVLELTLVFPREADIDQGKISVLAPLGTAMLGYSEGDEFEWPVPEGIRRLAVRRILFQPETESTSYTGQGSV